MAAPQNLPFSFRDRAALVVAHPGHELRVHGWLELARPRVFVLTDGSGRSGRSRLASTTQVLSRAGALPASIYGRLTDAGLYDALREGHHTLFLGLVEELAAALADERVEYVVGDATEGYNPAHDVCRLLIDAAVGLVSRERCQPIRNYDFLLVGRPDACPELSRHDALWLRLTPAAFERKMAAARAYAELAGEVDTAVRSLGADRFRVECLRQVSPGQAGVGAPAEPPFYERYGARQVAAGHYRQVLSHREHVLPLAEALRRHAERKGRWAA